MSLHSPHAFQKPKPLRVDECMDRKRLGKIKESEVDACVWQFVSVIACKQFKISNELNARRVTVFISGNPFPVT